MAVSVNDGGLVWKASVDTSDLDKKVAEVNQKLVGVAQSANAAIDKTTAKTVDGVNKLSQTIETLRAKILAREEFIIRETDLNKIALYNKEIESLKLQITQILSAGRTGFDGFGNALKTQAGLLENLKRKADIYKTGIQQATLPANIAKYNQKLEATNIEIAKLSKAGTKGFDALGNSTDKLAGKANLLSKGFGFFRQAAFLIPGLGIAGIFNLIGEGVSALVSELFKGNGALSTFAANFKNIKEVMAAANKESGKQIADLKILYTAATNVNISMKERLAAVDALQQAFPDYFGKISDEIILTGGAQKAYDALTTSIINSAKARAAKAKIDEIEAQKLDILFQKQKIENATAAEKARATDTQQIRSALSGGGIDASGRIKSQVQTKAEAQAIIEQRRLKAIASENKKEASLDAQELFLIKFAGEKAITKVVVDENKARQKAVSTKTETELNSLLEKRKSLLQSIIDLERDALQSGLTKQATEIDKINERREKELQLLKETNAAIDKYNAKHKVNIAKVGQAEIDRINNAADTLIKNATYKKDAAEYLEAIKEKQKAFTDFQKVQETGNTLLIEQARDANKTQLGDFENFVDLLQAEYNRLFDTLSFDQTDDIGTVTRFNGIKKMLDDAIKDSGDKQIQFTEDQFRTLLQQTETFAQKRFEINKKYNDLEATLEKEKGRFSPEELKARQKVISDGRAQDLKELENSILRQSSLYKKLSTDIIGYTRKQIKALIKELESVLKLDKTLTPQMKADIQSAIDQYKGLLNETNQVAKDFAKVSGFLGATANTFSQLADSVRSFNSGIADTLNEISEITKISEQAASAFVSFSTGDIAGGIASASQALTGIIEGFARAAQSARDAKQAVLDFQTKIIEGEFEYDRILRDRERQKVKLNKLTLRGIEDENKLLKQQRELSLQAYNDILKKLEQESFISGQHTKKKRGSLFGGLVGFFSNTKTKVVDELTSLAGKSFEELEKLFQTGQLTDSAKALFEQLQKIKDEGADIDALLEQNRLQVQELFTGTTAESIADSIIQGLEEGKRSVSDFADNFQDLMQQAFLNSLKFKYLEGPIQSFFEDFAAASESDGQLTSGEIDRLKSMYNSIITNAADQFEQLQQVAGINFNSPGTQGNTLTGAIKGMTEQQAELLAGQFGGLRITAIEQLKTAMQGIKVLQNIEINTARLHQMYDLWRRIELNGLKVV